MFFFEFLVILFVAFGPSDGSIGRLVDTVGRCRAHCLDRFAGRMHRLTDRSCMGNSDCFMCWENCVMMSRNWQTWGIMCEDRNICFPGCRAACDYYQNVKNKREKDLKWSNDGDLVVNRNLKSGTISIEWPPFRPFRESKDHPYLIYLVFWKAHEAGSRWRLLTQTIELDFITRDGKVVLQMANLKIVAVSAMGTVGVLDWPPKAPVVPKNESPNVTNSGNQTFNSVSAIPLEPWNPYTSVYAIVCFVISFVCLLIFGLGMGVLYIWYKRQQSNVVLSGRHYAFRDKTREYERRQSRRRSLRGPQLHKKVTSSSTTHLLRIDSSPELKSCRISNENTPVKHDNNLLDFAAKAKGFFVGSTEQKAVEIEVPQPKNITPAKNHQLSLAAKAKNLLGVSSEKKAVEIGEPQVIAIIEGKGGDFVTIDHALAKKILCAQKSVAV